MLSFFDKHITIDIRHNFNRSFLLKCLVTSIVILYHCFSSFGQVFNLNGTVVNEWGETMSGINIVLKGKTRATLTNQAGKFILRDVTAGDTLQVSGLTINSVDTVIPPGNRTITIAVTTRFVMDEEIVVASTGYQKIKPNEITGSVAIIDQKTLNLQAGTNILDRLNGVTTSILFPKGKVNAPALMVRGLSTINGPKDPLIIVDDFPYEGDINNINPNDVENITILKDAAAASIWGTRAGNGVIVITTKRGRQNSPMKISFNANVTTFQRPDLNYLLLLSSGEYIELERFLFSKGYYNNLINSSIYPALSPAVEAMVQHKEGSITEQELEATLNDYAKQDSRSNYLKDFYKPAINQQYNISLSGGGDKNTYLLSGSYDKNISSQSAGFERYSLRLQNTYIVFKHLTASLNAVYTGSQSTSGAPAFSDIKVGNFNIPYLRFIDDNGDALAIARSARLGFTDTLGGGYLLDEKYYALTDWTHNRSATKLNDIAATAGLNYQIIKGVDVDVKYFYERQSLQTNNLADINSSTARGLINLFTQLNRQTGHATYIVPMGGILDRSTSMMEAGSFRSQLNINRQFRRHKLTGLVGFEARQIKSQGDSYRLYGYNDENLTYSPVDVVNPYPTIGGSTSYIPENSSLSERLNRFISVFSNLAYTYHDKYIVSLSARRDASNLFGVNTNDKWNPLWSAGASWELSKEDFYTFETIPLIRLRLTYGYSGNTDPSMAAVTTLSLNSGIAQTNYPYAFPSNYANPELKWEKVQTTNLGLDFQVKGNRLSGSIEYFLKSAKDLFAAELLDYTTGLRQVAITKNVAAMGGRGVDFTLQSVNTEGPLRWTTGLMMSYYSDKVTDYYRALAGASTYIRNGASINSLVGLPVYSLISYRWAGLDPQTGDPQGYLNGEVSKNYTAILNSRATTGFADLNGVIEYSGRGLPKWYGSLLNTLSYKSFSVSFNLLYRLGYHFRYTGLNYQTLFSQGTYTGSSEFIKRWQKPGDEALTQVPSMSYPLVSNRDNFYTNSSATIAKGGHLRLQFINAIYDLPLKKVAGLKVTALQLYININNVGLLWKANSLGIDPDYVSSLPARKTWTFGIRSSF